MNLNTLVKNTLKGYGDGAGAHFGIKDATLKRYMKTGKYPPNLIEKILAEQKEPGSFNVDFNQPQPTQPPPPADEPLEPMAPSYDPRRNFPAAVAVDVAGLERRVGEIVKYLQTTVDFYIKQFNTRIGIAERGIIALSNAQLRATGMPNLARPDQNVPVDQTFTTNPNPQFGIGNAFDTGVAPTKAMVDAQANMTTLEGVPVPNAMIAHPAEYIPDQPPFGFGWNQPRPPRR